MVHRCVPTIEASQQQFLHCILGAGKASTSRLEKRPIKALFVRNKPHYKISLFYTFYLSPRLFQILPYGFCFWLGDYCPYSGGLCFGYFWQAAFVFILLGLSDSGRCYVRLLHRDDVEAGFAGGPTIFGQHELCESFGDLGQRTCRNEFCLPAHALVAITFSCHFLSSLSRRTPYNPHTPMKSHNYLFILHTICVCVYI